MYIWMFTTLFNKFENKHISLILCLVYNNSTHLYLAINVISKGLILESNLTTSLTTMFWSCLLTLSFKAVFGY